MTSLPPNPLDPGGIDGFATGLRRGEVTAEAVTAVYLERIAALDGRLGAYAHLAGEQALAEARRIDRLLAEGVDLGPLMGLPVAVKDIIAVDGMPTAAGSRIAVDDIIGSEGGFVRALRRCGCVLIGKTRTVEFALGATGINMIDRTPWNPWRADAQLIPGGSSSGSAVAVAAGLCAFAIGTDTGGSVRNPAAMCGLFGLKPTVGLWPTDGCFPLSPTFDAIGPIARTAADGAVVFAGLTGRAAPATADLRSLRLGRPTGYFVEALDPEVARCFSVAVEALAEGGAEIIDVTVPEAAESDEIITVILPELIAAFGRRRFIDSLALMDPEGAMRARPGLEISGDAYVVAMRRHRSACAAIGQRMAGVDAWLAPTTGAVAAPIADLLGSQAGRDLDARIPRNTRTVNWFGQCATTSPVQTSRSELPVGLQVACVGGADEKAVSIAVAVEKLMGWRRPDLGPSFAATA
jgi:aspartyl-tRNA(Asn)/glutamyl-tRNA(Gln) amidotransferase subunit A